MQLIKNGITVTVDDAQVVKLLLERLAQDEQSTIKPGDLPPIGTYWEGQGGKFTGIMRGRDGGPDYILISGPKLNKCNWSDMNKRAAEVEVDGHKDFRLPYRSEQSLQRANMPEEFDKEWHWSCEQHASYEDYAWAQDFSDGNQSYLSEDYECLGCAVRMIPIQ